jgi:Flp pilus assembly protein TadG
MMASLKHISRQQRSRRGAVAVEFALTASVLMVFVFASFDYSRTNTVLHTIDNASYEGCRRGIVPGATAADVTAAANKVLSAASIQGAVITVTPAVIQPQTANVTVTIDVPINQNSWITPMFVRNLRFRASYTLAREFFETVTVN